MRKYLISPEGQFYKANLHSHSNISDGVLTPLEMKELYKAHGYSVIAYTDHDVMIPHPELNDPDFLALTGFEMEFNENKGRLNREDKTCHLCFIAKSPDIKIQPCWNPEYARIGNAGSYIDSVATEEGKPYFHREHTPECINEAIKICRDAGFFVTYNHPVWSQEDYSDYMAYHGMNAMEVVNYACISLGYDENNATKYDDMLRGGERIYAVAADDNHNKRPNSALGGYVMIKAKKLEYTEITDALFKGEFYASCGPEIKELYVEDGQIHITTSDVVKISMTASIRGAKVAYPEESETINSASFAVDGVEGYVRITVTDKYGKSAYTRAYFTEEYM